MDKPAPNNPHLHDWLDTSLNRPKVFDPFQFDHRLALDTLSAGFGPMKAITAQQMALIQLASRRAQAYLGVPQRLSRCRTHQDVVEEQMRFWQTAMAQYQDSATLIYKAWTDAFSMPSQTAVSEAMLAGKPGDSQNGFIQFPSRSEAKPALQANGRTRPQHSRNG